MDGHEVPSLYLHLVDVYRKFLGKYTRPMDPVGHLFLEPEISIRL